MPEDYPRTLSDLERRFGGEAACRHTCLPCPGRTASSAPPVAVVEAWRYAPALWRCGGCRRETSVAAGTSFHDSKLPLMIWFRAMRQATSQKSGMSALGLQRVPGLESFRTARAWLYELRRAKVRAGRDWLRGIVEVDETCWVSEEEGHLRPGSCREGAHRSGCGSR
jgi:hypothetical protein